MINNILMEKIMKIGNEFKEAFASQKLIPTDSPSRSRYNAPLQIFTLEASDFDKAIDLLKVFNKKAGVKEFQLLKDEFISGKNCDDAVYSPNKFVQHLKDVLTKRMSDVESRIALSKVNDIWNFDEARDIDAAYKRISSKYHAYINCREEFKDLMEHQEHMMKIKLEFIEDIKSWLKEEVEENESSLDTLTINDWNDILQNLEFCDGRLQDLQAQRWNR